MKRIILFLITATILFALWGCDRQAACDVAATTLPVYEFTLRLCAGTEITATRIVTQSVSCLHDYTMQVSQLRAIQGAKCVVLSGAGLENFMTDALEGAHAVIDASEGLALSHSQHQHDHKHTHEEDPHIWLSPENAKTMAKNICWGLTAQFPAQAAAFEANLQNLLSDLDALQAYGDEKLAGLTCRELITFHDGFTYFAESFNLHIIKAVEEESGAEASAAELIELAGIVTEHALPAVFTERNGSSAAAQIIAAETDVSIYTLDMAMSGDSYFKAMYHNIDTIWEALG